VIDSVLYGGANFRTLYSLVVAGARSLACWNETEGFAPEYESNPLQTDLSWVSHDTENHQSQISYLGAEQAEFFADLGTMSKLSRHQ